MSDDFIMLYHIILIHIVSVLEQKPLYPDALKKKLKTLHIPLQDLNGADILQRSSKSTKKH